MKKLISIVMAILLVCSVCLTAVFAATTSATLTAKAGAAKANVGDTVTVTVDLSANSNLGTLTFNLKYDASAFEYVAGSLTAGGLFSMEEINDKTAGSLRYTAITGNAVTSAGTLVTAKFKVLKTNAAFSIDVEEAYDGNDNDVTASLASRATGVTIACAHGNTEWKTTTTPTHTATGTKSLVCTACQAVIKTESIPALGHTYGAWAVTTPATCTAEGVETRTCSCGATETRAVAKKAHNPAAPIITVAPTCTQPGEHTIKCADCGTVIKVEAVPATGHNPGEWVVVSDATCTEKGEKKSVCTVCGEEYTEEIPALGHTPIATEWCLVQEPTCTEPGIGSVECERCGEWFTQPVPDVWPALGHEYSDWTVTKEATATETGLKERTCATCGEKETEVIPKLGSSSVDNGNIPTIPDTDSENATVTVFAVITALSAVFGTAIIKRRKTVCNK